MPTIIDGRENISENVDENGRTPTIDRTTNAANSIDYAHHEIHAGSHYTCMYSVANIGGGTTPDDAITLTFVTPNTAKWGHLILLYNGVGGALCRMREAGTGGTGATGVKKCFNNNRNSLNVSGIKDLDGTAGQMSYDATLDTGGLLTVDEYISGASRTGAGAESGGRYEWILKQNTRYQVSIYSTASVAASIVLHWYEHTNK